MLLGLLLLAITGCQSAPAMELPAEPGAITPRTATVVIAASNSAPLSKKGADYICDGVADQREINQAIESLPSTSGRILLMEGNYNLSAPVEIDRAVVLDGIGAGYTNHAGKTQLQLADNANCDMIEITSTEHCIYIRDIYLYGNKAKQTTISHGVNIHPSGPGADGIWFYNLTVSDMTGDGVRNTNAVDIWFYGCCFEDCDGSGLHFLSASRLIWVHNAYFANNLKGIFVEQNTKEENRQIDISGGVVLSSFQHGIHLDSVVWGVRVTGVILKRNGRSPGDWSSLYLDNCSGIILQDNMATSGLLPDEAYKTANGIYLNESCDCIIAHNQISNHGKGGIILHGSRYNVIEGNNLRDNCGEAGSPAEILLTRKGVSFSSYHSIMGNVIRWTKEPHAEYGIREDSPSDDYNVIIGNIIEGMDAGTILRQGSNSRVTDN